MTKRIVILGLIALVATAAPAMAKEYTWKIFATASYVSPLSDSDIEAIGEAIEASSEVGWEVGAEWRIADLIGIELAYLDVTQDVEADSVPPAEAVAAVTLGELDMNPVTATANIHLIPGKTIDFWVGPSVSWVNWGDFDSVGGESVSVDSEFAYGAAAGIDIGLGKTFAITGGLRWLKLDAGTDEGDLSVDPLFARVGVAFRF